MTFIWNRGTDAQWRSLRPPQLTSSTVPRGPWMSQWTWSPPLSKQRACTRPSQAAPTSWPGAPNYSAASSNTTPRSSPYSCSNTRSNQRRTTPIFPPPQQTSKLVWGSRSTRKITIIFTIRQSWSVILMNVSPRALKERVSITSKSRKKIMAMTMMLMENAVYESLYQL